MEHLISQVEQWSFNKELHNAEPSKQFVKVVEEVGEIARALARSDDYLLRDAIGDVVVTLIILAQQHNMTLHECLGFAYQEIKDRTGEIVNGTFVKSEDLG